MELGGNLEEKISHRFHDLNNINNKPSIPADMYNMDPNLNMLHRRVVDEYPVYSKDGTFSRAIYDPRSSPFNKANSKA